MVRGARQVGGELCDLAIVDGRIGPSGDSAPAGELSTGARFVAPGYLDLQVNGAGGIDLTAHPEGLWDVAAVLPRYGVTSFLPTIVSSPPDIPERALVALTDGPPPGWVGARPLGLHLEGPFLSPRHAGAHDPAMLARPSRAAVGGWSAAAGVAMVTLAPELPGAVEVVADLSAAGVVVAMGHTEVDPDGARQAVAAGARAVTHLFNAMAPMHHRAPGLVGAVLSGLPVTASLLADGVHVAPEALRIAWETLGPDRRMLVSDASAALGAPAGDYRLGTRAVTSVGTTVRDADGALAGGAAGLDACMRHICRVTGCDPADAVRAVTATPATLLGRTDVGSLRVGALGDLVLLDEGLQVVATVVGGAVAYRRD